MIRSEFFSGNNFSIFFIPVLVMVVLMMGGLTKNTMAWPVENGIAICTEGEGQWRPNIVSDGSGGAIITWDDSRGFLTGSDSDIYAQRVDSRGVPIWTFNGVSIYTATSVQGYPKIISDGSGGAIITWQDYRNGNFDLYAQRVDSSGVLQWSLDGVPICTAGDQQEDVRIVSDGSGGAIITWQDERNGGSNNDIYAQRVDSSGIPQWTLDGIAICTAGNDQYGPKIVSDGSSGAIITWQDERDGLPDIYAQAIDSTGVAQWTLDGVAICTAAIYQYSPTIASDGSGGAIITWYDYRNFNYDIYAQRVNSSGILQWTLNGVAICTAGDYQEYPMIVSDGSGGAIITWEDNRSSAGPDIYVQSIDSGGSVPVELSEFYIMDAIKE